MTTTVRPPATRTDAPSIPTDLPNQVDTHMRTHFPDDTDAGGWTVARDYRDNTTVVVWRPAPGDPALLPGGARAVLIARWHMSLQAAGFTSEPRTDMEVFGRPDEQSDDGRARWLHITGWDPDEVVPPRSFAELDRDLRRNLAALRHSRRPGRVPARRPVADVDLPA